MAAFTRDFTFDQLSRIGEDSCGLSQKNVQNVSASNYLLTNFFSQDCGMKRPIEFATSQPNINFMVATKSVWVVVILILIPIY